MLNSLITGPMELLTKKMMNDHNNAKCVALEEAIKHRDVDIYLRGTDGIDIAVGCAQSELQDSARQFTIAILSNASLQVVVKVNQIKAKRGTSKSSDTDDSVSNYSQNDEAVKFTGRCNATQFLRTRTTISKSTVKNKPSIKRVKEEADDEKGEAYSMEDRLNSKGFHEISSIKLTSREETPAWYGILTTHGEMCGVFIPPWDSIIPDTIRG
jgi:hypothetical protein